MGHIARNCPLKQEQFKKGNKKFHAHAVEDDDSIEEKANEYEYSNEEYVLISSLIGSLTHGSDTWLVDNGASKHMIGYKDSLSFLIQKGSPHKVQPGD